MAENCSEIRVSSSVKSGNSGEMGKRATSNSTLFVEEAKWGVL